MKSSRSASSLGLRLGSGIAVSILIGLASLSLNVANAQTKSKKPVRHPSKTGAKAKIILVAEAMKPILTPVLLTYRYQEGAVQRYRVRGFLNGHIPPFATDANSPPVHILLEFEYVATVKKVTEKGAMIDFNVSTATLSLLEKEPPADFKIGKDDAAEFPVPLSEVQKLFNVVATIRPDGTVAEVTGGSASTVKVNIGLDLRKLFLITAPIAFSEKPVRIAESWVPSEGLLGAQPSRTIYAAKTNSAQAGRRTMTATLSETAESTIYDTLDKDGNSTQDKKLQVGFLKGEAKLDGAFKFVAVSALSKIPAVGEGISFAGRIESGRLNLNVEMKRTLPDPDKPGAKLDLLIDVKATFFVNAVETPPTKKK